MQNGHLELISPAINYESGWHDNMSSKLLKKVVSFYIKQNVFHVQIVEIGSKAQHHHPNCVIVANPATQTAEQKHQFHIVEFIQISSVQINEWNLIIDAKVH